MHTIKDFASPLHLPTKFGPLQSITPQEKAAKVTLCFPGEMWPESLFFRFPWQPLGCFSA